jgi:hypothetical protein
LLKTPRLWLSIVELVVGISMLSFAVVFVALGGGYAGCQKPATFTVQACMTVVEVSVVGLIGFGLTFFGIVGTIIGGLVRAGYLTPRQLEPHPQVASVDETNLLLATASKLLGEARLPRARSVRTISWSQNLPWYAWRFRSEGFRKPSQLVLPASLRGKLAPDEWKIILAYYFEALKPRLSLAMTYYVELIVPVPVLLLVLAGFKLYSNGVLLLFGNAITGILFLLWFIRIFPWAKRMNLKQDTWAANSLGRENLLRLFEKIDSLKLPEVENSKRRTGWIARLWPVPNITERTENLNSGKPLRT